MSKRKVDVRQQVLGFSDKDLKTSLHDEIVLWVKSNAAEIGRQLIGWTKTWDPQLIESERKRAAETVTRRMHLLEESRIKHKSRLEAINRGQGRFYMADDLEKQIKAIEGGAKLSQLVGGLG